MNPSAAVLFSAWATEHWWLAFWLVIWALVFGYGAVLALLTTVCRLGNLLVVRPLRALQVLCRGWPPAHLDADGDGLPAGKAAPVTISETVGASPHEAEAVFVGLRS